MDAHKFWLDDISELWKSYTIIPTKEMSENERLNTISRLCIFLILLILILSVNLCIILVPVTILVMIILYKKTNIMAQPEKFEASETKSVDNNINDINDIDYTNLTDISNVSNPSYSLNLSECRAPTPDNPLMNTPPVDYGAGYIPAACNADDSEINDDIKVNFNHGLFSSVYEVWERENAERQFYTMPNTAVPNNQTEFALWLYGLPPSANCKEEQEGCLRYDDLRSTPR